MSDRQTITVISRAPIDINLVEDVDKYTADDGVIVHGSADGSPIVTMGVDAQSYRAWIAANEKHPAVAGGLVSEKS
jgi:hypothetical protein